MVNVGKVVFKLVWVLLADNLGFCDGTAMNDAWTEKVSPKNIDSQMVVV